MDLSCEKVKYKKGNYGQNIDTKDDKILAKIFGLAVAKKCEITLDDILKIFKKDDLPRVIKLLTEFKELYSDKHNFKLLDLTKIINEPEDITHFIEPSIIGGKKITNKIEKIL